MIKYFLIAIVFFLPQLAHGAVYYIDLQAASCTGNGLATTTSFCSIDLFTDVARNAGDMAIVKRDTASTTDVTDILPASSGTLNNPITLTADYDNLWSTFATSSQTVTPVFGATTLTLSASSTITNNTWIYFQGDCQENGSTTVSMQRMNPCEYAYEVASTTIGSANTVLTLYHPYKGSQTAAGTPVRVMGKNPIWNTNAGDFQWVFNNDDFWVVNGIDIRGTDANCNIGATNGIYLTINLVLQGDGATDCGIANNHVGSTFNKTRTFGKLVAFNTAASQPMVGTFNDSFVDCNSVASSIVITSSFQAILNVRDLNFINCTTFFNGAANGNAKLYTRNLTYPTGVTNFFTSFSGVDGSQAYMEDLQGVLGANRFSDSHIATNALATTTQATTSNLRSGGGAKNLLVIPPAGTADVGISTRIFPTSYIKLFEYPIYTDTTSRTYTMYFNSTNTAQFLVDPLTQTAMGSTTPELYIECEYYNESSGVNRALKRSNAVNDVDFNGSTAWQDISVTCQPTRAGILYLRGFYAKTTDAYNAFFMDTTPTISP